MSYRIVYDTGVLRTIGHFPKHLQNRIVSRIGMLSDNPRPPGCIKLQGEDAYRVRVGDYRIIYSIKDDQLVVLVIDVGHRGDVYRRR